jgi:glycosyltransferase involved in cell wall biosynthesis
MLSAVIPTHDSERTLLPTLAALVPGAVAGIVREVIIADAGSGDATKQIADTAGCRVLTLPGGRGARLRAAADVARGSWFLFLQPGLVPAPGWIDEVEPFIEINEHCDPARVRAAVFRPGSSASRPLLVEALASLRAALRTRMHAGRALLIPKLLYHGIGGHHDVGDTEHDLMRRLGRRRITMLRSTAHTR